MHVEDRVSVGGTIGQRVGRAVAERTARQRSSCDWPYLPVAAVAGGTKPLIHVFTVAIP
jgi:hypothetical protein